MTLLKMTGTEFKAKIYRSIISFFGKLPLNVLYKVGDFAAWVMRSVVSYRKNVIYTNLARSFPEKKYEEILAEKFSRFGIRVPGQAIDMRIRLWYNPDFVTSWYIVPGIMGLLLTLTLISMMSMAIVRESEQGTLEQLLVTPMKIWELLTAKIIPYIIVGYVQIFISIVIGIFVFNMPFLGSMTLFYALTFFYVVASLSLGIMISCFAQNQTQALQMSVFIILPSVLLSGFVFPLESMPAGFRYLGECFPITYYINISRQIILKGGGLEYVWRDTLALAAYIAVMFTASVVMFKRRFVP